MVIEENEKKRDKHFNFDTKDFTLINKTVACDAPNNLAKSVKSNACSYVCAKWFHLHIFAYRFLHLNVYANIWVSRPLHVRFYWRSFKNFILRQTNCSLFAIAKFPDWSFKVLLMETCFRGIDLRKNPDFVIICNEVNGWEVLR